MKVKNLTALAGLGGALIMSASANAAYVGLVVNLDHNDGAGHDIYRVYAEFTNSADGVIIVNGNSASPLHIVSSAGAFFNPGGATANTAPNGGAAAQGTFVTIGISDQSQAPLTPSGSPLDATSLSPGFPNFIAGTNDFTNNNMGWFTTGISPQGVGSYINSGFDNQFRVMIMQLAVNTGSTVSGTVNIGVFADGVVSNLIQGQTFGVPAPGAIALLGLAGLVGRRRRG